VTAGTDAVLFPCPRFSMRHLSHFGAVPLSEKNACFRCNVITLGKSINISTSKIYKYMKK